MADDPNDPPADPADPPADPPQGDPPADPPAGPDDDLGDAGKRALAAERKRAKDAEKALKAANDRLAKLEEANQSEADKAIAAAKAEGRTEALAEANGRLLHAEIKAAAAGRLQNPDDAIALLDLSDFSPGDDGFDQQEITSAIDGLLEARPYLAAGPGATPPPGDPDSGARKSGAGQVTEAELDRMTPEQIEKAMNDGRLDTLLGRT